MPPAKKDDLNEYWHKASAKMKSRWQKFFVDHGLTIDKEQIADDEGWIEASGCVFNQSKISVNIVNGRWRDNLTELKGNIFQFINQTYRYPEDDNYPALALICKAAGIDIPKRPELPDPDIATPVSEETLLIIRSRRVPSVTKKLADFIGISEETQDLYKIGWFPAFMTPSKGGEYSIPIPNEDGIVKAIRMIDENLRSQWLKKIPRANKLETNQMIFGLDELKVQNWKNLIVTNSEFDRIILCQEIKSPEWGSIAIIDGYNQAWNPIFNGRNVVLVFSSDHRSIASAQNVVGPILKQDVMNGNIPSLKVLKLSGSGRAEDCKVYQWFKGGGSWQSMLSLISFAPEFELPGRASKNSDVKSLVSFSEIDDPENNGLMVRVPITISGEYSHVYDSIGTFKVSRCKLIESGECVKCKDEVIGLDLTSPKHLAAYEANERQILKLCIEHCCDVPGNKPTIGELKRATYRKVIASQHYSTLVDRDVDTDGTQIDGKKERLMSKHVIVNVPSGKPEPIEPRSYMATGAIHTNPLDSTRSMVIQRLEPIPEPYETFDFKLHSKSLASMQEIGWNGIVEDLIQFRTRMYGFDELLIINLLTLCSPLRFHFNAEHNLRGWIIALVVGDTGVGKSKTFEALMKMTGIGSIFNTKTGSRTGLTYATVRTGANGTGWGVQAGLLPICTRRILLIEEVQRLDDKSKISMSDAIYEGFMRVNTVARASYETMTRVIMNANCRDNKPLDDYPLGCLSVKDLFDSSYIRRIDLAAFIRKHEDIETYHSMNKIEGESKVTPEMMRHLIYFAWSLPPDRIEFDRDVTEYIMEKSMRMIERFGKSDDLGLVYASDFRFTLARLSLAWAVLCLSSTDEFKTIKVKCEHVNMTIELLTKLYAHPDCGLDKYSDQWARAHSTEDYAIIRTEFKRRIMLLHHSEKIGADSAFARTISILRSGVSMRRVELARSLGYEPGTISDICDYLLDHNLIRIEQERVKVTAKFNRVLDKMEKDDALIFVHIKRAGINSENEKGEKKK